VGHELVECHSGYTYAERPVAFYWQGERLEVDRIAAQWQAPDGKHFRVSTRDGQVFELVYSEPGAKWQVYPA